jgi:hypothetical protein
MRGVKELALAVAFIAIAWFPAVGAVEDGRAHPAQTLTTFSSGSGNASVYFPFPRNDTSVGIRLPYLITVTSATVELYSIEQVTNFTFDVGGGDSEWYLPGPMPLATQTFSFGEGLDAAVHALTPGGDGNVTVPIRMHVDTPGYANFSKLEVKYVFNLAPVAARLEGPEDGKWCTSLVPTLRFNTSDPDGDILKYYIELYRNGSVTPSRKIDQRQGTAGWSDASYTSGQSAAYSFASGSELDSGERYTWRVAAWDGYTFGPYSDFRTLPVDGTPPEGTVDDFGPETTSPSVLRAFLNLTDPDSGLVQLQYKLGIGTNSSDLVAPVNATDPHVTVSDLTLVYGRRYCFSARGLNGAGLWSPWISSKGVSLKKGVINHLPSVNITTPSEGATLTGLVYINGTASDIDFLDTLTVELAIDGTGWTPVQGNLTWTLGLDTTTISNGTHTITANAFDQTDHSEDFVINVTIRNRREIEISAASPASDPTISEMQSQVFSISASDPLGHEIRYQWTVDGIPQPGRVARTFTYDSTYASAGVHRIAVSALYGTRESTWSWNVTVLNVNRPPAAVISLPAAGQVTELGKTVFFDSVGSADPDTDDNLSFVWDFGDKTIGYGTNATHFYDKPGKYRVTLSVNDGINSSSASVELNVKETATTHNDFFTQSLSQPWCPAVIILGIVGAIGLAVLLMRRKKMAKASTGPQEPRRNVPITMGPTPVMPAKTPVKYRPVAAPRDAPRMEAVPEHGSRYALSALDEEAREAVRRQAEQEAYIPEVAAEPAAPADTSGIVEGKTTEESLSFGLKRRARTLEEEEADRAAGLGGTSGAEAPSEEKTTEDGASTPPQKKKEELDELLGKLVSDNPPADRP